MMLLWGSELSPFALKVRAMLQHARVRFRCLPAEGTRWTNARVDLAIEIAKRRGSVLRYGGSSPLDEYPLVPFLVDEQRRVWHDSSSIGQKLHDEGAELVPDEPAVRWVARLVDEAFDEFGLYMLHHNRWVVSARDNDAGARLSREFATLLPPGVRALFALWFSRRQVRRLPYLFSRPETHALLEEAWYAHLDAMESLLAERPFILGERFTLADASAFGHLGGNFIDPSAHARLRAHAPRTHRWLERIWRGEHVGSRGALSLHDSLGPLLDIVGRTFVPLMRQNEAAYRAHAGETTFNEAAFDRGRALYDGELLGRPFRSVVKTFQVRVWRDLSAEWSALASSERAPIERWLPERP